MKYILQLSETDELKIVEKEEVPKLLYSLKARIPYDYLGYEYDELRDPQYVDKLKKCISQIESEFPLFDIYSRNTYLIDRKNIYYYVVKKHYRRIDRKLYATLVRNIEKYSKQEYFYFSDILENLKKTVKFIRNYDHDELKKTYNKIIHSLNISEKKLENEFYILTSCIRHSFLPYILTSEPYYTKLELENLGLNMKLELTEDDLCKQVRKNDVKSWLILKHQEHIEKSGNKFLVEYYSFYGAYYMNDYLRNKEIRLYKNPSLEKYITEFWKLINTSPKLDRKYTIYRFIKNDDHLLKYQEGDIYINNSYMSCTRDPFYEAKDHVFGYILLKINLPEGIPGVCLFIETYSLFQKEQEIVMPPKSKFRITKIEKRTKTLYYHINKKYQEMIEKIYELNYEGRDDIKIDISYPKIEKKDSLNFNKLSNLTISEFVKKYSNEFNLLYNDVIYKFKYCWYDSTDAYKNYFFFKKKKGFYIYNQSRTGQINILIEIGEEMSVNYYHKYSENNITIFSDDILIDIISQIAKSFNIKTIYIHPNYKSCKDLLLKYGATEHDIFKYAADLTSYCVDIYEYLKYKKKRFHNLKNIEYLIDYKKFDKLEKINPMKVLKEEDRDNILKLYRKFEKKTKYNNLKEFYLFMLENYFYEIRLLQKKFYRLKIGDIFDKLYYKLTIKH